jgi:hypothetical protein
MVAEGPPPVRFAVPVEPDASAIRLSRTEVFAFGGIGVAGVTSHGEEDFRFILSHERSVALAAFEKLYANGNPQGKSYALSGIRKLSPSKFKQLLSDSKLATGDVTVMRGCIISHEPLGEVARQIDRGQFRF